MRNMSKPRCAAFLVTGILLIAGCSYGGDAPKTDSASDAQAGTDATALVPGAFSDLPKPGGAVPLSAPTQQGADWVQSFRVLGIEPVQVMEFYEGALQGGWEVSTAPQPIGQDCDIAQGNANGCTYRADWVNGAMRLEVTADPNDTVDVDDTGTELNLLLQDVR